MSNKATSLSFLRAGPRTEIRTPATIIEEEYGSVDDLLRLRPSITTLYKLKLTGRKKRSESL